MCSRYLRESPTLGVVPGWDAGAQRTLAHVPSVLRGGVRLSGHGAFVGHIRANLRTEARNRRLLTLARLDPGSRRKYRENDIIPRVSWCMY